MAPVKVFLLFACLVVSGVMSETSTPGTVIEKNMESFLTTIGSEEGFSAVQASYIAQGGETYSFSTGFLSLNGTEPVTNETLFGWGSITKEFTTSLLLRKVDEGSLSLTDTLGDHLPELFESNQWPQEWAAVQIVQLLNMTSGIPDYFNSIEVLEQVGVITKAILEVVNTPATPLEVVDYAVQVFNHYPEQCKGIGYCFQPGTSWQYSNTDYMIAGMLVSKLNDNEAITSLFQNIVLEKINAGRNNDPNVYFADGALPEEILSRVASAYDKMFVPGTIVDVTDTLWNFIGPAGGLIGSTAALAEEVYSLYDGSALGSSATSLLRNYGLAQTKDGSPVTDRQVDCTDMLSCYGIGIGFQYSPKYGYIYYYQGQPYGYRSVYFYLPCYDFIFVSSINSATADTNATFVYGHEVLASLFSETPELFPQVGDDSFCPIHDDSDDVLGFLAKNFT